MAEAIIWDVDGTLVDTGALHFDAWKRMSREMGTEFTQAQFVSTFGRRNPEIIHELYGESLSDAEIERIGRQKEGYYRDAAREAGIQLLPGVRELLEAARSAGWAQAIGSSAPVGNLEMILDLTGTRTFFGAVVGMEQTSKGKPDPEVFLNAAKGLGVEPGECVVLEDAVAGIEAAKAGGMASVGVTFVGHHSDEKLRAAGAGKIVASVGDLTLEALRELIRANRAE